MKTKRTILSSVERDIIILANPRLSGRYLSNSEIGQRLGMSVNSVKHTIHRACVKLEARNRNEAILFAVKRGDIGPGECCSLDELTEVLGSLGAERLRRIAHLVRQGLLPEKDEPIIPTARREGTILTKREREVLSLAGRGLPNNEIADRLYMSVGAVGIFLNRACAKLGACQRVDAVVRALNHKEISIGEIFSLNELVQFLAPFGAEFVEKTARQLNQRDVERLDTEEMNPMFALTAKGARLRGAHCEIR